MVDVKITIPESFFKEEIRSGYKVSSLMKQVWAVELDLLAEAMRVMDKYSIKYYAIGGTLLGAARHGGFIPWDDDIDIAIPRKDYERFRVLARKEFAHPYFFQDEFNSPGVLCGHAKLRNSNTTMIFPGQLKKESGDLTFNMGIFIDFFPIDNLPDDLDANNRWWKKLKRIGRNAWHLRFFTQRRIAVEVMGENRFKLILKKNLLSLLGKPNLLFEKYNRLLAKYVDAPTTKSCLYCLFCKDKSKKNRWVWNREWFDAQKQILLPFEFLKLPCPSDFDAVLTQTYGDWHEMIQANSEHGCVSETFYDVDRSYDSFFNEDGILDRSLVRKAMGKNRE